MKQATLTQEGFSVQSEEIIPKGWMKDFDASTGKPYYFNKDTNDLVMEYEHMMMRERIYQQIESQKNLSHLCKLNKALSSYGYRTMRHIHLFNVSNRTTTNSLISKIQLKEFTMP